MDDDQLQMLQREFMCVQQQKTNPLAERTVAQIMVKLHHEGFRFYPTTDGNQYLTPERLDKEILDLILQRGHINIGLLPQILNVGLDTIQGRVIKLLTKHSSESTNLSYNGFSSKIKIFRHNSILLSEKYMLSIIQSIKQVLLIQGRANLQSIALDNQFNIKFTEKFIKENIEALNAELINNQLITKEYNLMKKVKLLGFIRAITNPISFQNLLKASKLSENDDIRTLQMLLQQIIHENKVRGKYQNSYYIPDSFVANQRQRILQFFNNNGFIQFQMLQKQFLVSKPEEWLKKNLTENKKQIGDYTIFEDVCIKNTKLQAYAHQIQELLKTEGFLQISNVLPFNLQEKQLQKFLTENCKLGDYFLFEGFCYSQAWLGKVIDQFKQKIFKQIFISSLEGKTNAKGTAKNKGGKKQQKAKLITQQQLVQKLYNQGLAQYSVAENIAPALLPILIKKIQDQTRKIEKDLGQSKGILSSNFLKYKSCNTIMKNIDGLQRNLNIIQKQKKKSNQDWIDKQFGPNETDQKGRFSLIYYDGVLPKNWPSLQQNIKWQRFTLSPDHQLESGLTASGCLFVEILASLQKFNKQYSKQRIIMNPLILSKQLENHNKQNPYVFSFYRQSNDRRHVIVDNRLPLLNDKLIGYSGIYGFAQKAYSKFRYCYKGILNLGIKTLLFEMTGQPAFQFTIEKNNVKDIISVIEQSLKENKLIILVPEGQTGKKIAVNQSNQQQKQEDQYIQAMKPYIIIQKGLHNDNEIITVINARQNNNNSGQKVAVQKLGKIFKNLYVL